MLTKKQAYQTKLFGYHHYILPYIQYRKCENNLCINLPVNIGCIWFKEDKLNNIFIYI